ncbi:zinc-binding dehydrogenase [Xylariomycetidae sp. FL0641]|nr:zinc-binding dehydrogenase [Xylariomycetidae sp. FL0641]
MGTTQNYKFEGWQAHDVSAAEGKMVWGEFAPRPWEETDVDIQVTHCGMCGSDLHYLRNNSPRIPRPVVVGHEIVGRLVRVGALAPPSLHLGDRVGVGCLTSACGACAPCAAGQPNYCRRATWTYMTPGSHGGYATYHRTRGAAALAIPDAVPGPLAATLMCAGATTFAPLRALRCQGKKVGVVGLGGLGHFAVLFAKALGAECVVAVSRREEKRGDALALGADAYLATDEESGWDRKYRGALDFVIATVASAKAPMAAYLKLLKYGGTLVQVGQADDGDLQVPTGPLIMNRLRVAGSAIASPDEMREMLRLVADKGVRAWVQEIPMKNANQAIRDMGAGKPRYRYCLVNEDRAKASL